MKTVLRFALAVVAVAAALGMSGCTDTSSRNTLTVVSVNNGNAYFSDLINTADTTKPYIPVDEVPIKLGNIPNGGGAPLAPGDPYSEIVVTGYTVTWDNGIYQPLTGGLNLRISSGGTADGSIVLDNSVEKAALLGSMGGSTVSTVARVHFIGYNYIDGIRNGDSVWADAAVTVQVGNFGDTNVNTGH
jgi:hypothetical protein